MTAFVICLVLILSLYRLNKANNLGTIAGDIIAGTLERVSISNDYMRNNGVRAKEQWFARHEQISGLLRSALENFRDSEDRKNITGLIEDHEASGKIFSAIVANREKSGLNSGSDVLSREVEDRLLSQLNMRVYEETIHSRKMLESARKARNFAIKAAGWGVISALIILIATALINLWSMGRAITARVARLREGAAVIGGGDLEHRIDVRGDDEFAEIGEAFNAMTATLRGSYRDLENEVVERKRAEESLRYAKDELEMRVQERTHELRELNETQEERIIERTAQLNSAIETLRDSRVAALNLMEDAVVARRGAEETNDKLLLEIDERKRADEERQASVEFLGLVNESRNSTDLIRRATLFFHKKSGCEAVGIRLKEGDDYPYFEAHGFPEEFVSLENHLCDYNESGEVVRDSAGDPVIECMCGNIIRGRYDPSKPFFTNSGSFWSNCTTELLASTTEAERQTRTRNRCNGEGYESVALIPLSMGEERLGLLQLNDRRNGRFSPATIALWERLAGYLSVALTKFKAEETLEVARLEAIQEKIRLEAVMESLPVGVAILDVMGGLIRSNSTFEKVWGGPLPLTRTVKDYRGYKAWWVETGQPVQPEEWASARAMRNDESLVGQLLRIERFDGSQAYIHNSAAPFHDPSGRIAGCAVAIMDITDQIETQEALEMAKEAAEAASRAKSQFLANMSHELRTPMTGVLGMLEFTLNTTLDAQQRDFIETAHKSARTLLRILNDILDLAKVEAGKLSIEAKPFALSNCVAGAIDILLPEARRKGLELICTLADDLPKAVVGDQVRLLQVLTNLCGNAVKFTDQGKVEVNVSCGGETPEGKREITFTVTDTGIGIPDDKKELIFGSFNQADISHARRYGGTGLGLAISRELVERMGGAIACVTEEGKGSTFSFTISLAEALPKDEEGVKPVTAAPPPVTSVPVSAGEMAKARLLLAEDDPITRKVIGMMLKHAKFDHDIAENGLRAVDMWENGNYDLILMDVQMPGQDGFAATGAIRERERERGGHTIIVAMTAHAFPEDEKRCLAAGMDAYIPKPIDLQKCVEMIGELISKRDQDAL
jgi:signal transduction histidine kinase/methyl-accepting chemotaxis protein/ActR/RegA family two-component response regulator